MEQLQSIWVVLILTSEQKQLVKSLKYVSSINLLFVIDLKEMVSLLHMLSWIRNKISFWKKKKKRSAEGK